MVFSKLGAAVCPAAASISARAAASAASKAGRNCSTAISPNGGRPNGVVQVVRSGLVWFMRPYLGVNASIVMAGLVPAMTMDGRLALAVCFRLIAAAQGPASMDASATPPKPRGRRIHWLNVITVMSAAILIGVEVFGAA